MFRAYLPHTLAACTLVAGSCLVPPCQAAKVKTWHHHKHAQYDKAKFRHAATSSTGTLRLARRLQPLAAVDATHVWAAAEDRAGNLFAATGDEGKIYKIAEGKAAVAYTSPHGQVLSLAAAADGGVYAGTGPAAQVVRIDARGQAKVLCELEDSYVWALAVDPKTQAVYAGTGPKGRIYRITPDGKARVFYETKQDHVLCLAVGPDGTLYAGTDKTGRVLKIDAKGKGFVLYQAAQSEIRTLLLTTDALYAGTSSPAGGKAGGATARRGGGRLTARVSREEPETAATKIKPAALPAKGAARDKESNKASAAPPPSSPGSGENSVYSIAPDGAVREVFRAKGMILSLLKHGKHLFVGTGMEGLVFEVNEATRERSEVARLDHGQILALHRRPDGSVVVATGDPGKLYVLKDAYAAKGTVTSDVLDAGLVSKWGALRWRASTPGQTSVTVAVRSGNVAEPDETWSEWSEEQANGEAAVIAAPAARFLQYRVTLATADPAVSPALRSITLRYATTNQAPEVKRIDVPDLNAATLENPKKLKLKWSATDANEDDLTYSLYVRKDGWDSWVLLEEDLERTDFEWDTTTTPSGVYRVKVVASDRKDNPEKEALTGESVSAPFVVCHTAPAVTVKVAGTEGRRTVIEATAASPLARLTAASFAVNGKKWVNVFPTDGLFDSKTEAFRFKTAELKAGTYVLVLKVKDAAGNVGSADVVFSVPGEGASARK
jgi:hypothetical protein